MFAKRVGRLEKSFIREILKITSDPAVISFAGGLPNPDLFPIEEIATAAQETLSVDGAVSLQYASTEGHEALREFVIERYYSETSLTKDNVIITNGSQQALDLLGKLFIDDGDKVVMESPGYLGAIQAFSVYQPEFLPVTLQADGLNLAELTAVLAQKPKLLYTVSNFQNPSGISYTKENRQAVLEAAQAAGTWIIDDNPYGEINFSGKTIHRFVDVSDESVISLGSFSKIFCPSMRLGWIAAPDEVIEQLVLLKQGADLHTNYFSQCVLANYLKAVDLDRHIQTICQAYQEKRDVMIQALKDYLPEGVDFTQPEGGMFLWVTLPENLTAYELLERCMEQQVVFVPGDEFYTDGRKSNSFRMNYTNSSEEEIKRGVQVIAKEIQQILDK